MVRIHPGPLEPTIRRATPDDADALARGAVEGVADYVAFAPAGWAPPDLLAELAHTRVVLADPAFHCFVAELDGEVVGQVTVVPAASAARPVEEPGLGHLRNLYVARSQWGSGLAPELDGSERCGGFDRSRGGAVRLPDAARHPARHSCLQSVPAPILAGAGRHPALTIACGLVA